MALELALDLTGVLPENFIQNEVHSIGGSATRYWVPTAGCFYTNGLELRRVSDNYLLKPGIDYKALHFIPDAAMQSGKQVCAIIWVHNTAITGDIKQSYHAVGGQWSATTDALEALLVNLAVQNSDEIAWGQIVGAPDQYPPAPHGHNIADWYGMGGVMTMLENIRQAMLQGDIATIQMIYQYIDNAIYNALNGGVGGNTLTDDQIATLIAQAVSNHNSAGTAHSKTAVGLSNVPNWSALAASDATVAGASGKTSHFISAAHVLALIGDRVTKAWLGVDNVQNLRLATALEGIAGSSDTVYLTPSSGTETAKGLMRSPSDNVTPNTSTLPFQIVRGGAAGAPTTDPTHRFLVVTTNIGTGANAITATTVRFQVAIALVGTKGIWARSHNGTSFGSWAGVLDKAFFGLDKVDNYATATNIQAIEGTATNLFVTPANLTAVIANIFGIATYAEALGGSNDAKAMSSKKVAAAIRFQNGSPGITADPDTTINRVFFANTTGSLSLAGLEPGKVYRIENFFTALDGSNEISTNSPRVQIAHHPSGGRNWTRTFDGTTWGSWSALDGSKYDRLYSNTNRGMLAQSRRAVGGVVNYMVDKLDANFGIVAGYVRNLATSPASYEFFFTKPGHNGVYGMRDALPSGGGQDIVNVTVGAMPAGMIAPATTAINKAVIQLYEPFSANAPLYILNAWADKIASNYVAGNTTSVRSALTLGQRNMLSPGASSNSRQLRVAGSYAISDITVHREDPNIPGEFLYNRVPSATTSRAGGISTMLLLENMVTKNDFRVMFLMDLVGGSMANQRYGVPLDVDGSLPNHATVAPDTLLTDASITSASTQISYRIPTDGVTAYQVVGCDSTDKVHAVVLTKPKVAGSNGQFSIDLFLPQYTAPNWNTPSSFKTVRMTSSLSAGEQVNAMCMFQNQKALYQLGFPGYVYVAVVTNLGRVIVYRMVDTLVPGIDPGTFVKVLDDYTPTGALSSTESGPIAIGYAGGCFWIRTNVDFTSDYDIVQPWVPQQGTVFTQGYVQKVDMPSDIFLNSVTGSCHKTVYPVGNQMYFNLTSGLAVGNINYMDSSFY